MFHSAEPPSLAEWLRQYAFTDEGKPWDDDLYPWWTAPGGPCDAFEALEITDIWLQMATRLGKTFWALFTLLYTAAVDPMPMMFSMPNRPTLKDKLRIIYATIEHCPPLAPLLLPEHKRTLERIDLGFSTIWLAISGSPSTLADKEIARGVAAEIDKWEASLKKNRGEADSLKLFDQRFLNRAWRKRIKESTPTIEGKSRIERGRLNADDRAFWVPCPHCGEYQVLQFEPGPEGRGGIVFDRDPGSERIDPLVARRTTRYLCALCGQAIRDGDRPAMMRAGRWALAGQTVQPGGFVVGEALRAGPEASFHLPSWYSLIVNWGDMAAEFAKSYRDPREHQNFANSWGAKTWKLSAGRSTAEQVRARICQPRPLGIVPEGMAFLTIGVDRQVDHWVWSLWGWGRGGRSALVLYGTSGDWHELDRMRLAPWQHADGGEALRVAAVAIDEGYEQEDTQRICVARDGIEQIVLPVKGFHSLDKPWRLVSLSGKRSRRALGDPRDRGLQMSVNYWQQVTQRCLDSRTPEEERGMSWPEEVDDDFVQQMLNETPSRELDTRNYEKVVWKRVDENYPNDFRDSRRLAHCVADWLVQGNWERVFRLSAPGRATPVARSADGSSRPTVLGGMTRPDGRSWL